MRCPRRAPAVALAPRDVKPLPSSCDVPRALPRRCAECCARAPRRAHAQPARPLVNLLRLWNSTLIARTERCAVGWERLGEHARARSAASRRRAASHVCRQRFGVLTPACAATLVVFGSLAGRVCARWPSSAAMFSLWSAQNILALLYPAATKDNYAAFLVHGREGTRLSLSCLTYGFANLVSRFLFFFQN